MNKSSNSKFLIIGIILALSITTIGTHPAFAAAPTILSAAITNADEITVTYDQPVFSQVSDYGFDVNGGGANIHPTSISFTGVLPQSVIILHFTAHTTDSGTDETGTLHVGTTDTPAQTTDPHNAALQAETSTGVAVTDASPPSILGAITIKSNNVFNNQLAKAGDIVKVHFVSDEPVTISAQTICGSAAVVTGGPLNWFIGRTMVAGDCGGDDNTVTFSATLTEVAAPNALIIISATTDGSQVIFDSTPPVITTTHVESNNPTNNQFAKAGDVVKFDFTADEPLNSGGFPPTATIAGIAAASVVQIGPIDGTQWEATSAPLPALVAGDDTKLSFQVTSFQDLQGNVAPVPPSFTDATDSTFVIFDATAATFTNIHVQSNNVVNNQFATTSDVLTISFTTDESLDPATTTATVYGSSTGVTVTPLNPGSTTDPTKNTIWQITRTFTNGDTNGLVPFAILGHDMAGFVVSAPASNDGSTVTFDNVVPIIPTVHIQSNNIANNQYGTTGDVVTLTFTANEQLAPTQPPFVTIGGSPALVTNTLGNTWVATKTLPDLTDGPIPFVISNIKDNAGNVGLNVLATTDASSVTFDDEPPTVFAAQITGSNQITITYSEKVTSQLSDYSSLILSSTGSRTITGISGSGTNTIVLIFGGAPATSTETGTMSIGTTTKPADLAGLTVGPIVPQNIINSLAPTLSTLHIQSNNVVSNQFATTGNVVTLTFTSSKPIQTPVVTIDGRTSPGPTTVTNLGGNNWQATTTMLAGDPQGLVTYLVTFQDLASDPGSPASSTTDGSSVTFDNIPPSVVSAKITGPNQITIIYSEAVHTVQSDYTNLSLSLSGLRHVTGMTGSETNTIVLTFDGPPAGVSETAVITMDSPIDFAGNVLPALFALPVGNALPPVLSPVHIQSNNVVNTAFAKNGDVVTVTFTSSKPILTPVVKIFGSGAGVTVINTGGNTWTASKTVTAPTPSGVASFLITFTDTFGNAGTPIAGTTDSSSVTVFHGAPVLFSVHIQSNNANPSVATIGDTTTITFVSNRPLQTPVVTIAGEPADTVTNIGGNVWQATALMDATDPVGAVAFNISFSDQAGNAGVAVTATTDATVVTFDPTIPTLLPGTVHIQSNNGNPALAKAGNTVTITFTSSETLQTPSVTIDGIGAFVTNTGGNNWSASRVMVASDPQGVVALVINFKNLAGGTGIPVTATNDGSSVTFDSISPTLTSVNIASSNAIPTAAINLDVVTIDFTSNEPIKVPVVTMFGSASGVTVTNPSTDKITWVITKTIGAGNPQGVVPFAITIKDLANNAGGVFTATTDSSSVTVDHTKPIVLSAQITAGNQLTVVYSKPVTTAFTDYTALTLVSGPRAITGIVSGSGTNTIVLTFGGVAAGLTETGTMNIAGTVTDLPGVALTAVVGQFVADQNAPTIYTSHTVSIASSNANPAAATIGDTVTISITANNAILTPTVTIDGHAADTVTNPSTDGIHWFATRVMQAADPASNPPNFVPVTFTVTFADSAGNVGAGSGTQGGTTDGSSVLYDPDIPTLTFVNISSNNPNTATVATAGDTVTVLFTANEIIQTPSVTIDTNPADSVTFLGGNTWQATRVMQAGDPIGTVAFGISFSDLANVAGSMVTGVTDASAVTFDPVGPVLTSVKISSNNANPAFATIGDTVSLKFTSNVAILTPTVAIDGFAPTSLTNPSGNNWVATHFVSGIEPNGQVMTYSIFPVATDGVPGLTVTTTTDLSSVTIDTDFPFLSSVHIQSNNPNGPTLATTGNTVTLTFTANEKIQTPPTVTIDGHPTSFGTTLINPSGNTWVATRTMITSDPGSSEAGVFFSITFNDMASNGPSVSTTTTDGSFVFFDSKKPTLNSATIVFSNPNFLELFYDEAVNTTPTDYTAMVFSTSGQRQVTTVFNSGSSVIFLQVNGPPLVNGETGTMTVLGTVKDLAGVPLGTPLTLFPISNSLPPGLSTVHIQSDNANPAFAKTGNTATITFTAAQTITNVAVTIKGTAGGVTVTNTGGNTWTATKVLNAATAQGQVPFTIDFTDLSSNAGSTVAASTDGSSVTFDNIVPTIFNAKITGGNQISVTYSESVLTIPGDYSNLVLSVSGSRTVTNVANSGANIILLTFNGAAAASGETATMNIAGTVKDLAGNALAPVVGQVVTSSLIPTLPSVSIASNNLNPVTAVAGNTVTVTFTASKPIQTPSVTINGAAATVTNTIGNTWTASRVMLSSEPAGPVAFTINFVDLAADIGIPVSATTDSSVVTFNAPTSTPTLASVAIASNNANTGLSAAGNIVTITFTSSIPIQTPTVTIDGNAAGTITNTAGNTWKATRTMQAGDAKGAVTFNISFSSLSSVAGAPVTTTTDSSVVTHYGAAIPSYVSDLLTVFGIRADLQSAFPEVNQGNLANLMTWAAQHGVTESSSSALLTSHIAVYKAMNALSIRPDLQAAFPEAANAANLSNLLVWAGQHGITESSTTGILTSQAHVYKLMITYSGRADLQAAFPEAANAANLSNLLVWAGQHGITEDVANLASNSAIYKLMIAYSLRPDLQAAFPEATNAANLVNLFAWANTHGFIEVPAILGPNTGQYSIAPAFP